MKNIENIKRRKEDIERLREAKKQVELVEEDTDDFRLEQDCNHIKMHLLDTLEKQEKRFIKDFKAEFDIEGDDFVEIYENMVDRLESMIGSVQKALRKSKEDD